MLGSTATTMPVGNSSAKARSLTSMPLLALSIPNVSREVSPAAMVDEENALLKTGASRGRTVSTVPALLVTTLGLSVAIKGLGGSRKVPERSACTSSEIMQKF